MKQSWIGGPTHELKQQHLPGYQGHVAFLVSDGEFGKSFAAISNNCMNKQSQLKQQNKGVQKCEPHQFQQQQVQSYYSQEFQQPQQVKSQFINNNAYQEAELENLLKSKRQCQQQQQMQQQAQSSEQKKTIDNIQPIDRQPILGYQGYRSINRHPLKEVKEKKEKHEEDMFINLQEGFQKELLRNDQQLRQKVQDKQQPIVGYTGHIHQLVSENQYGHSYNHLVKTCHNKQS